ncbi:hypothetical protein LMG29542_07186 [Paraburkholderia humisilvae]|uniref:Uncharacterized protein n=1 Tax=Paraburkholderia humisilvae TaxID=627669 RepID=A0A6J5F6U7_9BURK|nr:hypothetical protein LMG29542_07186 [Paraburkholderia humisilvae]
MKGSHALQPRSAGPVWELVLGPLLVFSRIGFWFLVKPSRDVCLDESLSVGAVVVGTHF